MATLESTIKMINRRLKDVEKIFTKKSLEYHKIKNIIYQELGGIEPLVINEKGTVRLSRSRKVLDAISGWDDLQDIVEDVWRAIKDLGTINELLQEYTDEPIMNVKNDNDFIKYVQTKTYNDYTSQYTDDDLYTEVVRLLLEEGEKRGTDDFDGDFYNALGDVYDTITQSGVSRDYKYAVGEKMLVEAKLKHEEEMLRRQTAKAGQKADMGSNE